MKGYFSAPTFLAAWLPSAPMQMEQLRRLREASGTWELKTIALGATIGQGENVSGRTFKTAWFAKAARKAHITDMELCEAIKEVMLGQADDLGGGVFKKRLNNNMHRSIILAKGGRYWIYQYLFAKSNRENIDDDELIEFRRLAKVYEKLTVAKVKELMADGELTEIFNGNKAKI